LRAFRKGHTLIKDNLMGWNTTVVVYNDAVGDIAKDPEFGKNLAAAILGWHTRRADGKEHLDVPAGSHANACMVVASHHADSTSLISVGGNLGIVQDTRYGWDHHTPEGAEKLLRSWADKLGFELVKRASLD
jgi:hypothetical protein